MSKGRQQERQVEKQNSMDKPKYRLSLRNESCWFAKELCTLDSSLFFKVCKHDSNYLINKHDSLHWVDLQFAGEEMRNGVSEGIDFIKGSLHVSWVLWLTVNFHIYYLVSICQQCYKIEEVSYSHPTSGQASLIKERFCGQSKFTLRNGCWAFAPAPTFIF